VSLLDAGASVLLVHAHPDDETIATGALIAEMVARGIRVSLLTATRGERGEVVPGPLAGLAGTAALTAAREHELQRATAILGVTQQFWLGEPPARAAGLAVRRYRDSGMTWIRPGLAGPADDVEAEALALAPLDEVAADVAALITVLRPASIISYDSGGGYGHPDHVRLHVAVLQACRRVGTPFAEIRHEQADADEWFDLGRRLTTVTAALRCHASQLTVDGTDIVHSGGQREPITTSIGLRLLPSGAQAAGDRVPSKRGFD
jgi:N-acetyl-1-D-myo-inositol-2-amino-2-deoxy-alpha-D-glucopyranoside deacetylase